MKNPPQSHAISDLQLHMLHEIEFLSISVRGQGIYSIMKIHLALYIRHNMHRVPVANNIVLVISRRLRSLPDSHQPAR
jgi:hypothetical protein